MMRRNWLRMVARSLRPKLSTSSARFARSSVLLARAAASLRSSAACCLVQA